MKLPCHNRLIQLFPDAMHTIKDAVEHVFNIITGAEDSVKVRNAEAAVNQFGVSRTGDTATGTLSTTGCNKQVPLQPSFSTAAHVDGLHMS